MRVVLRRSDFDVPRPRARANLLRDALELRAGLRGDSTVILATLGIEGVLVAALLKAGRSRTRVELFDFLAPRRAVPRRLSALLFRLFARIIIIRRGDAAMLERRFGVPAERCRFTPWPVVLSSPPDEVGTRDYVYAAGWAHRDWPTLVAALARTGLPAVLAVGHPLHLPDACAQTVRCIDMPSPDEGRQITRGATVVAVPMLDTDLPSGPLVLLDALAMGKAVVVTDVNGTRDYVSDGETALVVPPRDVDAMAQALVTLHGDAGLRDQLGRAAQRHVRELCSLESLWEVLSESCR